MPIRFECPHCERRLSVGSRMASQRVRCPKCRGVLTVPAKASDSDEIAPVAPVAAATGDVRESSGSGSSATSRMSASPAAEAPEDSDALSAAGPAAGEAPVPPPEPGPPEPSGSEGDNPFIEFAVFDREETQWVYETEEEIVEAPVDENRVAIPRTVLYVQGGLLAATGLVCFLFGILIGSTFLTAPPEAMGPVACTVRGRVEFAEAGAAGLKPDRGTVVVILPRDRRPDRETKMKIERLHPSDTPPAPDDPAVQAIRNLGGDYARVNEQGEYELRVPDVGNYYLLFVSNNAFRDEDEPLDKSEISQMGNYFAAATNMVQQSEYQWQTTSIRGDKKVNVVF